MDQTYAQRLRQLDRLMNSVAGQQRLLRAFRSKTLGRQAVDQQHDTVAEQIVDDILDIDLPAEQH